MTRQKAIKAVVDAAAVARVEAQAELHEVAPGDLIVLLYVNRPLESDTLRQFKTELRVAQPGVNILVLQPGATLTIEHGVARVDVPQSV
jgi:hypothetical protein